MRITCGALHDAVRERQVERLADRCLRRGVGDQHDRHSRRRVFGRAFLHDRLERNLRSPMRVAIAADRAGAVGDGEAHVIAALVALHRERARLRQRIDRAAESGTTRPRATSAISAATAEAVASPPAPGPTSVSEPTASPSIVTALSTPMVCASGCDLATIVGCTRCSMPCARALGDAEQLDAVAEFVGGGEIGERDRLDAFDRDRGRVDPRAEGERGEDGELVRGVEAADVEGRIGLGVAELLRLGEADVERQPLRSPCATGCNCRCRSGCRRRAGPHCRRGPRAAS